MNVFIVTDNTYAAYDPFKNNLTISNSLSSIPPIEVGLFGNVLESVSTCAGGGAHRASTTIKLTCRHSIEIDTDRVPINSVKSRSSILEAAIVLTRFVSGGARALVWMFKSVSQSSGPSQ